MERIQENFESEQKVEREWKMERRLLWRKGRKLSEGLRNLDF